MTNDVQPERGDNDGAEEKGWEETATQKLPQDRRVATAENATHRLLVVVNHPSRKEVLTLAKEEIDAEIQLDDDVDPDLEERRPQSSIRCGMSSRKWRQLLRVSRGSKPVVKQ